MAKDVSFQGKPPSKTNSRAADAAFASLGIKQPQEAMKRLTINVPASLHARVKLACVKDDVTIADVVRNFLEQNFSK